MKIQHFKELGCYFVRANNKNSYLLNFDTNRVIQVPANFDEFIDSISDAYLEILRSENIVSAKVNNFNFDKIYKPTSVTFLMTTRCNLHCTYCYAYNNCNRDLSFITAKTTVDYLINNAITSGLNKITVRFHGLGEPTQNFDVLKEIVEYTKRECSNRLLLVVFHITSNGVMNDEQRDYIQKNFDFVTLSIDGTKPYQNTQRPLLNGDSFYESTKTLNTFKDKKNILIRTTVTNFNLENLDEWCEFLYKNGIRFVNIEPVSICGNCLNSGVTDLDNSFCSVFENLCRKYEDMKITYSCFKRSSRPFHCGAFGDNMVVTPFDDISTCYECFDVADKSQSLFIIGKIQNGKVEIYDDKVHLLNETCLKLRNECSNCYAQTFCNGSCLSKRYKSFIEEKNSHFMVANKCKITKKIIDNKLSERFTANISFTQSEKLFY